MTIEKYLNQAELLCNQVSVQKAIDFLDEALLSEVNHPVLLNEKAYYLKSINKYPLALENLNKALNQNPEYESAIINRADIFIKLERWDDSLKDYTSAINLNPTNSQAYFGRALVKLGYLEDYKSALEDCDFALKFDKQNYGALSVRAIIKTKIYDLEGALADYNLIINHPNHTEEDLLMRNEILKVVSDN